MSKNGSSHTRLHPLASLRAGINHLFDRALSHWPGGHQRGVGLTRDDDVSLWPLAPKVDIAETDGDYQITAGLPGLSERDVELTLTDDVVMLKGEKHAAREEKHKDYYLSERRYGAFQRTFTLPADVDVDNIDAAFRRGVLTVTLPKSAAAESKRRTIAVKAG